MFLKPPETLVSSSLEICILSFVALKKQTYIRLILFTMFQKLKALNCEDLSTKMNFTLHHILTIFVLSMCVGSKLLLVLKSFQEAKNRSLTIESLVPHMCG